MLPAPEPTFEAEFDYVDGGQGLNWGNPVFRPLGRSAQIRSDGLPDRSVRSRISSDSALRARDQRHKLPKDIPVELA